MVWGRGCYVALNNSQQFTKLCKINSLFLYSIPWLIHFSIAYKRCVYFKKKANIYISYQLSKRCTLSNLFLQIWRWQVKQNLYGEERNSLMLWSAIGDVTVWDMIGRTTMLSKLKVARGQRKSSESGSVSRWY